MFGNRLTLFRLLGFEVKLDFSWVILALLITWSLAAGYFPAQVEGLEPRAYWSMGIIGAFGVFFSIVFHEFSHSLVARRYGLPIKGITLFIFGGVAEMEEEPREARTELYMAIAGPIASLFLAACFYLISNWAAAAEASAAFVAVTAYLALINLILACFNMVPAFPLDGGRVFRALLWMWRGDQRWATRTAAASGSIFAYLLMGLGILSLISGNIVMGIWWWLIGMFLLSAARGSYMQMETRRALEGESVRKFMVAEPVTVTTDTSIAKLVDSYVQTTFHEFYPVLEKGRLVGFITTRRLRDVPRERWHDTAVGDVYEPVSDTSTVSPETDALHAMAKMQKTGNTRLLVTRNSHLIGIITLKDILRLLSLKVDLHEING